MRMLRLVVPALVASAVLASAASAASTQQAAHDRFAQDAAGRPHRLGAGDRCSIHRHGHREREDASASPSNASAGTAARAAVDRYAALLGVSAARPRSCATRGATTDALGQRHVVFEQVVGRRPRLRRRRDRAPRARSDTLNGFSAGVSRATSGAASQASICADQARGVALGQVPDAKLVQAPKLYVYTGVPFGSHPATLA